jgi:hypothetical protein
MKITRRAAALGGLGLLATGALSSRAFAVDGPLTDLVEGAEDFEVASDADVYGYPLVTMEMTRRVVTNVAQVEGTRGPMGQIIKLRSYPDASYRDVTAPNADTLYTTAFFDVGDEPWVLSVPDMKGRYFLLPFLDGWTNVFAVPGSRTTGTQAQTFVISGPGWSGAVPDGMTELKSPTAIVWLLGRIYCAGTPEDYAAVHALQDQFKLQPLSTWGKEYAPPPGKVDPAIDMKTAVRNQVNRLSASEYFTLLADLMKRNPPAPADAPALERFKAIGLVPGQSFDSTSLDSRWDRGLPQLRSHHAARHVAQAGERLAVHDQDRPLRDRLSSARFHHRDRARREPPAGRDLPHVAATIAARGLRRLAQLHPALREGSAAAGQGVLVAHHV